MNFLNKPLLLLGMISCAAYSIYAIEEDLALLEQQLTALAYAQPAEESDEDVTETPDLPSYREEQKAESEEEELQDLLNSIPPEQRPFF